QRFYFTSQGSQILPYSWFLALERPDSQALFRDSRNLLKYRYLPQKPDAMNPDGLPVGFVKDAPPSSDRAWLGFTCAACHTGQLNYNGVGYRIDGGPTLADVRGFLVDLASALKATRQDDAKFRRFAEKVRVLEKSKDVQVDLASQVDLIIRRRDGYNA